MLFEMVFLNNTYVAIIFDIENPKSQECQFEIKCSSLLDRLYTELDSMFFWNRSSEFNPDELFENYNA
jgi:hypothetical protein